MTNGDVSIKDINVSDVTLDAVGLEAPASEPVSAELAGVSEGLVEKINNLENLTKAELLTLNKQLSDTVKELSEQVAQYPAEKDKLVNDINNHYKIILDNKNRTINYFVKKFKLIEDLLKIERED